MKSKSLTTSSHFSHLRKIRKKEKKEKKKVDAVRVGRCGACLNPPRPTPSSPPACEFIMKKEGVIEGCTYVALLMSLDSSLRMRVCVCVCVCECVRKSPARRTGLWWEGLWGKTADGHALLDLYWSAAGRPTTNNNNNKLFLAPKLEEKKSLLCRWAKRQMRKQSTKKKSKVKYTLAP